MPERPNGPGSPERPVWFEIVVDLVAIPTTVARAVAMLEASWSLRSPREVVSMAARQASPAVAPGEPVPSGMRWDEQVQSAADEEVPIQSGMRWDEWVQSAPDEWVPRSVAAAAQAPL